MLPPLLRAYCFDITASDAGVKPARCWTAAAAQTACLLLATLPALQALGRGHKVCPYYTARKWAEVRAAA